MVSPGPRRRRTAHSHRHVQMISQCRTLGTEGTRARLGLTVVVQLSHLLGAPDTILQPDLHHPETMGASRLPQAARDSSRKRTQLRPALSRAPGTQEHRLPEGSTQVDSRYQRTILHRQTPRWVPLDRIRSRSASRGSSSNLHNRQHFLLRTAADLLLRKACKDSSPSRG
jgi:hypothetical protein